MTPPACLMANAGGKRYGCPAGEKHLPMNPQLEAIRTRRQRAEIDPLTFTQHAKSDMDYLLALLTPRPLAVAAFDPKTVYRDSEGHLCVPLPKRVLC